MGNSDQPNYCKDIDGQKLVMISAIISCKLAEDLTSDEQNVLGNLLEAVGQNLLSIQAMNQMVEDCANKCQQSSNDNNSGIAYKNKSDEMSCNNDKIPKSDS